jgi:hypothetical protein
MVLGNSDQTAGWQQVDLVLPSGYKLTEFDASSWDRFLRDFYFSVDDITFSLPSAPDGEDHVPDGGSSAILLGISCVALGIFRRGSRYETSASSHQRL